MAAETRRSDSDTRSLLRHQLYQRTLREVMAYVLLTRQKPVSVQWPPDDVRPPEPQPHEAVSGLVDLAWHVDRLDHGYIVHVRDVTTTVITLDIETWVCPRFPCNRARELDLNPVAYLRLSHPVLP